MIHSWKGSLIRSVAAMLAIAPITTVSLAAPLLQETFYEGVVPYVRTASGGLVRADQKTQAEIHRFRARIERFGIQPIVETPAVRRLRATIGMTLPPDPTPEKVWQATREVLNWLYGSIAPGQQGYRDMMGSAGWPRAERIADYWGRNGQLAWAACFSKAHLAFQIFRIVGLPVDDFGIASAHYRDGEGRTTPTHVYLGLRVGKEWFYIDPGTERDLGPFSQRSSVGAPLMQRYGPGVDYKHPYSFRTVGGPGRFIGVPLLGKPAKTDPAAKIAQNKSAESVRTQVSVTTEVDFGEALLTFFELDDRSDENGTVGCGDRARVVKVKIPKGREPLGFTLDLLLRHGKALAEQHGLYHPLSSSHLKVARLALLDGEAVVELKGRFAIGGVCDTPRVMTQLEQLALQFPNINKVRFYINDVTISALLDQR